MAFLRLEYSNTITTSHSNSDDAPNGYSKIQRHIILGEGTTQELRTLYAQSKKELALLQTELDDLNERIEDFDENRHEDFDEEVEFDNIMEKYPKGKMLYRKQNIQAYIIEGCVL